MRLEELVQLNDENLAEEVIRSNDVQNCLSELLDLRESQHWIPVSERLPTKEEYTHGIFDEAEFIVLIDGAEIPTTLYFDGYIWFDINFGEYDDITTTYKVTHWKKLPEPPEQEV